METGKQRNLFFTRKRSIMKTSITVVTLCAFLLTSIGIDLLPRKAHAQDIPSVKTSSFISAFNLPQNLGKIDNVCDTGSNKIVINILDAHCNYDAEKKISEIVSYLVDEYGIATVNLEGGEGEYDHSVFTDIDNLKTREKVADYFVKEGILNGAEYFKVNNPDKIELWGVEDNSLYLKNLKTYKDSLDYKDEVDGILNKLTRELNILKLNMYSKDLLKLDKKYAGYKADNIEFKDYLLFLTSEAKKHHVTTEDLDELKSLTNTLEKEDHINFKKANSERDKLINQLQKMLSKVELEKLVNKTVEFHKKDISQKDFYEYIIKKADLMNVKLAKYPNLYNYSEYVSIYHGIDKSKVMNQIESLEDRLKDKLCTNDNQRELAKLSKNLVLMKNLFNHSLTKKDYEYYQTNKKAFSAKKYISFIEGVFKKPVEGGINKLNQYLKESIKFYDWSFKRDKAFVRNLRFQDYRTQTIDNRPQVTDHRTQISIVVTGGFHGDNLCDLLKEENISYISIMPEFTNKEDYKSPYFKLLSGRQNNIINSLKSEVSSLALYSDFCKNAAEIYGEDEVLAKELRVELVIALFDRQENIQVGNRVYSFIEFKDSVPIEGVVIEGKQVYAENVEKTPDIITKKQKGITISSILVQDARIDRILSLSIITNSFEGIFYQCKEIIRSLSRSSLRLPKADILSENEILRLPYIRSESKNNQARDDGMPLIYMEMDKKYAVLHAHGGVSEDRQLFVGPDNRRIPISCYLKFLKNKGIKKVLISACNRRGEGGVTIPAGMTVSFAFSLVFGSNFSIDGHMSNRGRFETFTAEENSDMNIPGRVHPINDFIWENIFAVINKMKDFFHKRGSPAEDQRLNKDASIVEKGALWPIVDGIIKLIEKSGIEVTPKDRVRVQDITTPLVEELLMLFPLFIGGPLAYIIGRGVFVLLHPIQVPIYNLLKRFKFFEKRAEEKTNLYGRTIIPALVSIIAIIPIVLTPAAVLSFSSYLVIFAVALSTHFLANRSITLDGREVQRSVQSILKRRLSKTQTFASETNNIFVKGLLYLATGIIIPINLIASSRSFRNMTVFMMTLVFIGAFATVKSHALMQRPQVPDRQTFGVQELYPELDYEIPLVIPSTEAVETTQKPVEVIKEDITEEVLQKKVETEAEDEKEQEPSIEVADSIEAARGVMVPDRGNTFSPSEETFTVAVSLINTILDYTDPNAGPENRKNIEFLILMTMMVESNQFDTRVQYSGGPARGLAQFEPETVKYLMHNIVDRRASNPDAEFHEKYVLFRSLLERVLNKNWNQILSMSADDFGKELKKNDLFSVLLARINYFRGSDSAIPSRHNLGAVYDYYETIWAPGKPIPFDAAEQVGPIVPRAFKPWSGQVRQFMAGKGVIEGSLFIVSSIMYYFKRLKTEPYLRKLNLEIRKAIELNSPERMEDADEKRRELIEKTSSLTEPERDLAENRYVPLLEETAMVVISMFLGIWFSMPLIYIGVRLAFVAFHAYQDYEPPVDRERTLFEKIIVPAIISGISITATLVYTIFFQLTPLTLVSVGVLSLFIHVFSNFIVTVFKLKVQKAVLDKKPAYKTIKTKSDFAYETKNKKILYIKGVRYEFDKKNKFLRMFDIKNVNRDWQKEILEISVELKNVRDRMVEITGKYEKGKKLIANINKWFPHEGARNKQLKQQIQLELNLDNISYSEEEIKEIENLLIFIERTEALFPKLIKHRNLNFKLIPKISKRRERRVKKAVKALKETSAQTVNLYVQQQHFSGVMGTAQLIADALVNSTPDITVNIFVVDGKLPRGFDGNNIDHPRINIQEVLSSEIYARELNKLAGVHVGVYGLARQFAGEDDVFFETGPFPNIQGAADRSVMFNSQKTNVDLRNPYGTLILDPGIRKRRLEKDFWGKERIISERKAWHKKVLTETQNKALNSFSRKKGWNPEEAILSWGYFQRSDKFITEVLILRRALLDKEVLDKMPFTKNGKQVVIHLVTGGEVDREYKFTPYTLSNDLGINVIDKNGDIYDAGEGAVPITIILHKKVDNADVRTLQSELTGTLKRDKKNKFWIDFPVFITGSGSWLEAISAGSIYMHDDYDTPSKKKEGILMSALRRWLVLDNKRKYKNNEEIDIDERKYVKKLLMGRDEDIKKYADLEEWTNWAREYSDAMFKFNMIDEILIQVAEVAKKKHKKEQASIIAGKNIGGAWFGRPVYMRWISWWIEPLLAFTAAGGIGLILGISNIWILTAAVSAVLFWAPHVFRGKTTLLGKEVIGLTIGTFITGIPIFALGLLNPLTLASLSMLTIAHIYININAVKTLSDKEKSASSEKKIKKDNRTWIVDNISKLEKEYLDLLPENYEAEIPEDSDYIKQLEEKYQKSIDMVDFYIKNLKPGGALYETLMDYKRNLIFLHNSIIDVLAAYYSLDLLEKEVSEKREKELLEQADKYWNKWQNLPESKPYGQVENIEDGLKLKKLLSEQRKRIETLEADMEDMNSEINSLEEELEQAEKTEYRFAEMEERRKNRIEEIKIDIKRKTLELSDLQERSLEEWAKYEYIKEEIKRKLLVRIPMYLSGYIEESFIYYLHKQVLSEEKDDTGKRDLILKNAIAEGFHPQPQADTGMLNRHLNSLVERIKDKTEEKAYRDRYNILNVSGVAEARRAVSYAFKNQDIRKLIKDAIEKEVDVLRRKTRILSRLRIAFVTVLLVFMFLTGSSFVVDNISSRQEVGQKTVSSQMQKPDSGEEVTVGDQGEHRKDKESSVNLNAVVNNVNDNTVTSLDEFEAEVNKEINKKLKDLEIKKSKISQEKKAAKNRQTTPEEILSQQEDINDVAKNLETIKPKKGERVKPQFPEKWHPVSFDRDVGDFDSPEPREVSDQKGDQLGRDIASDIWPEEDVSNGDGNPPVGKWIADADYSYLSSGAYSRVDPMTGKRSMLVSEWEEWPIRDAAEADDWVTMPTNGRDKILLLVPPDKIVVRVEAENKNVNGRVYYDQANRIWYLECDKDPGNTVKIGIRASRKGEFQDVKPIEIVGEYKDNWKDLLPEHIRAMLDMGQDLSLEEKKLIKDKILNLFYYSTNPNLKTLSEESASFIEFAFRYYALDCDGFSTIDALISHTLGIPAIIQTGYGFGENGVFAQGDSHAWILNNEGIEEATLFASGVSPLYNKVLGDAEWQKELGYILDRAEHISNTQEDLAKEIELTLEEQLIEKEAEELKRQQEEQKDLSQEEQEKKYYKKLMEEYTNSTDVVLPNIFADVVNADMFVDECMKFNFSKETVKDKFQLMSVGHFMLNILNEISKKMPGVDSQKVFDAKQDIFNKIKMFAEEKNWELVEPEIFDKLDRYNYRGERDFLKKSEETENVHIYDQHSMPKRKFFLTDDGKVYEAIYNDVTEKFEAGEEVVDVRVLSEEGIVSRIDYSEAIIIDPVTGEEYVVPMHSKRGNIIKVSITEYSQGVMILQYETDAQQDKYFYRLIGRNTEKYKDEFQYVGGLYTALNGDWLAAVRQNGVGRYIGPLADNVEFPNHNMQLHPVVFEDGSWIMFSFDTDSGEIGFTGLKIDSLLEEIKAKSEGKDIKFFEVVSRSEWLALVINEDGSSSFVGPVAEEEGLRSMIFNPISHFGFYETKSGERIIRAEYEPEKENFPTKEVLLGKVVRGLGLENKLDRSLISTETSSNNEWIGIVGVGGYSKIYMKSGPPEILNHKFNGADSYKSDSYEDSGGRFTGSGGGAIHPILHSEVITGTEAEQYGADAIKYVIGVKTMLQNGLFLVAIENPITKAVSFTGPHTENSTLSSQVFNEMPISIEILPDGRWMAVIEVEGGFKAVGPIAVELGIGSDAGMTMVMDAVATAISPTYEWLPDLLGHSSKYGKFIKEIMKDQKEDQIKYSEKINTRYSIGIAASDMHKRDTNFDARWMRIKAASENDTPNEFEQEYKETELSTVLSDMRGYVSNGNRIEYFNYEEAIDFIRHNLDTVSLLDRDGIDDFYWFLEITSSEHIIIEGLELLNTKDKAKVKEVAQALAFTPEQWKEMILKHVEILNSKHNIQEYEADPVFNMMPDGWKQMILSSKQYKKFYLLKPLFKESEHEKIDKLNELIHDAYKGDLNPYEKDLGELVDLIDTMDISIASLEQDLSFDNIKDTVEFLRKQTGLENRYFDVEVTSSERNHPAYKISKFLFRNNSKIFKLTYDVLPWSVEWLENQYNLENWEEINDKLTEILGEDFSSDKSVKSVWRIFFEELTHDAFGVLFILGFIYFGLSFFSDVLRGREKVLSISTKKISLGMSSKKIIDRIWAENPWFQGNKADRVRYFIDAVVEQKNSALNKAQEAQMEVIRADLKPREQAILDAVTCVAIETPDKKRNVFIRLLNLIPLMSIFLVIDIREYRMRQKMNKEILNFIRALNKKDKAKPKDDSITRRKSQRQQRVNLNNFYDELKEILARYSKRNKQKEEEYEEGSIESGALTEKILRRFNSISKILHVNPIKAYSLRADSFPLSKKSATRAEFLQHREYMPGDDIRNIDWKVSSKVDKTMVREYETKTTRKMSMFIDMSTAFDDSYVDLWVNELVQSIVVMVDKKRVSKNQEFLLDKVVFFLPNGEIDVVRDLRLKKDNIKALLAIIKDQYERAQELVKSRKILPYEINFYTDQENERYTKRTQWVGDSQKDAHGYINENMPELFSLSKEAVMCVGVKNKDKRGLLVALNKIRATPFFWDKNIAKPINPLKDLRHQKVPSQKVLARSHDTSKRGKPSPLIGKQYENVVVTGVKEDKLSVVVTDVKTEQRESLNLGIASRAPPSDNQKQAILDVTPDENKSLIEQMLSTLPENVELYIYKSPEDKDIKDLFGIASPEKQLIALHESVADNPVALFHEIGEYLIKSNLIDLEFDNSTNEIIIKGIERIEFSGETLAIAEKDTSNPHYLLRALQRDIFGEEDRNLTSKIKSLQTGLVDPENVVDDGGWRPLSYTVSFIREISNLMSKDRERISDEYFLRFFQDKTFKEEAVKTFHNRKLIPSRIDTYISNQAVKQEQAIVELIANAQDATSGEKSIGRFGVGAYQMFQELKSPEDSIVVTTSTDGKTGLKLTFKYIDGVLNYSPEVINNVSRKGTIVEVNTKLSSEAIKDRTDYLKTKLRANARGKIVVNGQQINNVKKYRYINGDRLKIPDIDPVEAWVSQEGYTIMDKGSGMSPAVLFNKFMVPKGTTKELEDVLKEKETGVSKETKIFYSDTLTKEAEGMISVQVNGVTNIDMPIYGMYIPEEMVVELPYHSWLPESRDKIALDEITKEGLVSIIDKITNLDRDIKDRYSLLNGLVQLIRELSEESKDKSLFYKLQSSCNLLVEKDRAAGKVFLPNREDFKSLKLPSVKDEDIIFLDESLFNFYPNLLPGVEKVDLFRSSTHALYIADLNIAKIDDVYMEGSTSNKTGWIILDKKTWETHKKDPFWLNRLFNLNMGYGDKGVAFGRVIKVEPMQKEVIREKPTEKVKKIAIEEEEISSIMGEIFTEETSKLLNTLGQLNTIYLKKKLEQSVRNGEITLDNMDHMRDKCNAWLAFLITLSKDLKKIYGEVDDGWIEKYFHKFADFIVFSAEEKIDETFQPMIVGNKLYFKDDQYDVYEMTEEGKILKIAKNADMFYLDGQIYLMVKHTFTRKYDLVLRENGKNTTLVDNIISYNFDKDNKEIVFVDKIEGKDTYDRQLNFNVLRKNKISRFNSIKAHSGNISDMRGIENGLFERFADVVKRGEYIFIIPPRMSIFSDYNVIYSIDAEGNIINIDNKEFVRESKNKQQTVEVFPNGNFIIFTTDIIFDYETENTLVYGDISFCNKNGDIRYTIPIESIGREKHIWENDGYVYFLDKGVLKRIDQTGDMQKITDIYKIRKETQKKIGNIIDAEVDIIKEVRSGDNFQWRYQRIVNMQFIGNDIYFIEEFSSPGRSSFRSGQGRRLRKISIDSGEVKLVGEITEHEERMKSFNDYFEAPVKLGENIIYFVDNSLLLVDKDGMKKILEVEIANVLKAYTAEDNLFICTLSKEGETEYFNVANIIRIDKNGSTETVLTEKGYDMRVFKKSSPGYIHAVHDPSTFLISRRYDKDYDSGIVHFSERKVEGAFTETVIFDVKTHKKFNIAGVGANWDDVYLYFVGKNIFSRTRGSSSSGNKISGRVVQLPFLFERVDIIKENINILKKHLLDKDGFGKFLPEIDKTALERLVVSAIKEREWTLLYGVCAIGSGITDYNLPSEKTMKELSPMFEKFIVNFNHMEDLNLLISFFREVFTNVKSEKVQKRIIERWFSIFKRNRKLSFDVLEKMTGRYAAYAEGPGEASPLNILSDEFLQTDEISRVDTEEAKQKLSRFPVDLVMHLTFLINEEINIPLMDQRIGDVEGEKVSGEIGENEISLAELIRLRSAYTDEVYSKDVSWERILKRINDVKKQGSESIKGEIIGAVKGQDKVQNFWIRELVQNGRDAIRGMLGVDIKSGFLGHGFYTVFAVECDEVRIKTGNGEETYQLTLIPEYDSKQDLVDIKIKNMSKYKSSYKGTQVLRVKLLDQMMDEKSIIDSMYVTSQAKRFLGAISGEGEGGVSIYLNDELVNEDRYKQIDENRIINIINAVDSNMNEEGYHEWISGVEDPVGMDLYTILNNFLPPDESGKPVPKVDNIGKKISYKLSPDNINRVNVDDLYVDEIDYKYTEYVPDSVLKILLSNGWNVQFPQGTPVPRTRSGVISAEEYAPWVFVSAVKTLLYLYLEREDIDIPGMPKDYIYSNSNAIVVYPDILEDANKINAGRVLEVDLNKYNENPHALVQLLVKVNINIDGEEVDLSELKEKVLKEYDKKEDEPTNLTGVLPKGLEWQRGIAESYIERERRKISVDITEEVLNEPILIIFDRFIGELNRLIGVGKNRNIFTCIFNDAGARAGGDDVEWNLAKQENHLGQFYRFLLGNYSENSFERFIETYLHETGHTLEHLMDFKSNVHWTHQSEQYMEGTLGWIMHKLVVKMINNLETPETFREDFLDVVEELGYKQKDIKESYDKVVAVIEEKREEVLGGGAILSNVTGAIHGKETTEEAITSISENIKEYNTTLTTGDKEIVIKNLDSLERRVKENKEIDSGVRSQVLFTIRNLRNTIDEGSFVKYNWNIGMPSREKFILGCVIDNRFTPGGKSIALVDDFFTDETLTREGNLEEVLLHEILAVLYPEISHADHKSRYADMSTLPEGIILPEGGSLAGIQKAILRKDNPNILKQNIRDYLDQKERERLVFLKTMGKWLATSENWQNTTEYMKDKEDVYLGVGSGGQNLSRLAHGNFELAIIMDINPYVTKGFIPIRNALLEISQSRAEYIGLLTGLDFTEEQLEELKDADIVELLAIVLETPKTKRPERLEKLQNTWESIKNLIDRDDIGLAKAVWEEHSGRYFNAIQMLRRMAIGDSWLANEENFLKVKKMAEDNKIIGLTGDWFDPKSAGKIMSLSLKNAPSDKQRISVVYISNIMEWLKKKKERDEKEPLFNKLLSFLGLTDNAILIHDERGDNKVMENLKKFVMPKAPEGTMREANEKYRIKVIVDAFNNVNRREDTVRAVIGIPDELGEKEEHEMLRKINRAICKGDFGKRDDLRQAVTFRIHTKGTEEENNKKTEEAYLDAMENANKYLPDEGRVVLFVPEIVRTDKINVKLSKKAKERYSDDKHITVIGDRYTDLDLEFGAYPDIMARVALARHISFFYRGGDKIAAMKDISDLLTQLSGSGPVSSMKKFLSKPISIGTVRYEEIRQWQIAQEAVATSL